MKNNILKYMIIALVFAMSGCMKDDVVLNDPSTITRPLNIDAPVFNAHFSVKDILDRIDSTSFIYTDEDDLLHVVVDTTLSTDFDDMIPSWDNFTSFNKTFDLSGGGLPFSLKYAIESTDTAVIELDPATGQRADSMITKAGKLKINISGLPDFSGKYIVELPSVIKDGVPIKVQHDISSAFDTVIELDRSFITFEHNSLGESLIKVITTINADPEGIPSTTKFSVSFDITDIEPERFWGNFGHITPVAETGDLDFGLGGDEDYSDYIQFKEIFLSIFMENYIGVPISVTIDSMILSNSTNGESINIIHSDNNTMDVPQPDYPGDKEVIPAQDSLILNSTNSDIVQGVNLFPDNITYTVRGEANKGYDNSHQNWYIASEASKINTRMVVDVPLWFKTLSYKRTDTIDFIVREQFEDTARIDAIEKLILLFDFDNGLPFSVEGQLYAMDSAGNVIDSLFEETQKIWRAPVVDIDGETDGSTVNTPVDLILGRELLKKMWRENSQYMLLKSNVYTGGQEDTPEVPDFVKLKSSYTLDIKMSIKIVGGTLQ